MTCKVQNVASTRHYLDVSNRNYGGHAKVYFMSSLEGDDAISRRKIDSKVITEEPTVNRFMDPIEMEWQRNPEAAQKPSESSKTNEGEKSEPKNDKTEDKKPKKEDESEYLCCT
ncbi:hypothetical protein M3Y94_00089800 [Aphelenchoides besseyi]|nr:hypothetical protein M3Y94_00089800 [Aphelenchoides besseyi]KAI6237700.1 hypothetical protein M3Y95_00292800 [Aphelenchoides besseyi]